MRNFWMKIRMPLAVLLILGATLVMARLFSGPEDTWIKNDRGEWVMHGKPSAPAPAPDYRPPVSDRLLPWVFFVSFALPLLFLGMHKYHNRLTFDKATRDIRFLGYLSTSLVLFGLLVSVGIQAVLWIEEPGDASPPVPVRDLIFLVILAGYGALSILLGVLFFVLKRNSNDHYHLERSRREILEALEGIQKSGMGSLGEK